MKAAIPVSVDQPMELVNEDLESIELELGAHRYNFSSNPIAWNQSCRNLVEALEESDQSN